MRADLLVSSFIIIIIVLRQFFHTKARVRRYQLMLDLILVTAKKANANIASQFNELKELRKKVKCQIKYDLKHYGNVILNDKDHHSIWRFIRNVTFTTTKSQTTTMDPHLLNDYFASVVHDPEGNECNVPSQPDVEDVLQIQLPSEGEIIHLLESTDSKS